MVAAGWMSRSAQGRPALLARLAAWRPVAIGAVIAAGVLAVVGVALVEARRDAWDRASDAAANLSRALERDLSSEVKAIDLVLRSVADLMGRDAPDGTGADRRREIALERLNSARYLDALLLLDAAGDVVFDTRQRASQPPVTLADRDYFLAHRDRADTGLFVSKPFRSRLADGLWSIGFSRRLSHPDGSFAGVALGVIRLRHLAAAFEEMQLGPRGSLTLFRGDGIILARSPADDRQLGRDLSDAPAFRLTQRAPSGNFTAIAALDGVERFYTYRRFDGAPITVNVAMAVEDIYEAWWRKATIIGAVTLLLTTAMVVMVALLQRELGRRRAMEAEARRSEATFRLLAENSSDVVSHLDLAGRRFYISPAAEAIYGRPIAELVGRSSLEDVLPDDAGIAQEAVARLNAGERDVRASYRIRRPDGGTVWIEAAARLVTDERSGAPDGIVAVVRDVTERKALEDRLVALARTDGLTGLANRRSFDEALAVEWRRAKREGTPLSLLLVDIDRFKLFNDHYGHLAGDACLRDVAGVISAAVRRPADLVARYGGEEMVVLLPNTHADGAQAVAEQVRAAVEAAGLAHAANQPLGLVTISIGVATVVPVPVPEASIAPEALVAAADEALYRSKRGGRNCVSAATSVPPAPQPPPVLEAEEARLAALAAYKAVAEIDPASEELARIARLAAALLGTPMALVSLVDREIQTFAASVGLETASTPREVSFCAHLVASDDDSFVVPDAALDPRFAGNPLVTEEPNIRFYAGAPLVCPTTGHRLGALCSIDSVPRPSPSPTQIAMLADLAAMTMDVIVRHRRKKLADVVK